MRDGQEWLDTWDEHRLDVEADAPGSQ
jgi:hypothetical protein